MKRIHWHWDGGNGDARNLSHYHFVIDHKGEIHAGKPPEVNAAPLGPDYVRHTRGANSNAIAICVAGMAGAKERPFRPGPNPINEKQIEVLVDLTADLCDTYGIPVSRKTTLSHAEVQPNLGIRQRGKWDIAWMPPMPRVGDPVEVGDALRRRVKDRMAQEFAPVRTGFLQAILAFLRAIGVMK